MASIVEEAFLSCYSTMPLNPRIHLTELYLIDIIKQTRSPQRDLIC